MGLRTLQLFAGADPACIQHGTSTIFYRGRREILTCEFLDSEWNQLFEILRDHNISFECGELKSQEITTRTPDCRKCPCFREDLPDSCALHSRPHESEWETAYSRCSDPDRPDWNPEILRIDQDVRNSNILP